MSCAGRRRCKNRQLGLANPNPNPHPNPNPDPNPNPNPHLNPNPNQVQESSATTPSVRDHTHPAEDEGDHSFGRKSARASAPSEKRLASQQATLVRVRVTLP